MNKISIIVATILCIGIIVSTAFLVTAYKEKF